MTISMHVPVRQFTVSHTWNQIVHHHLHFLFHMDFLREVLGFYHSNCWQPSFSKKWCYWKEYRMIWCWHWTTSRYAVSNLFLVSLYFPGKFKILCGVFVNLLQYPGLSFGSMVLNMYNFSYKILHAWFMIILVLYLPTVFYIRYTTNIYRHTTNICERANKLKIKEPVINYNFHRLNFNGLSFPIITKFAEIQKDQYSDLPPRFSNF